MSTSKPAGGNMIKTQPAAAIDLFDGDELVALARYDIEQGRLDEALRKLKQALMDEATPSEALSMIARLYAQIGLFERAKDCFQKYLQAEPGALIETFQLGMTHFDAGQRSEALTIWEELLKQHPTHPPALFYTALIRAQDGKIPDARQSLDILLKSAPADNLYFGRAKELLRELDAGQAPTAAQDATGATPHLPADAYQTEH